MRVLSLVLVATGLAMSGCGRQSAVVEPVFAHDDFSTSASSASSKAALDALWPNDDGRSWSYDFIQGECGPSVTPPVYPDLSQVPAAPSPADVVRLLPGDRPGPPLRGGSGTPTACLTIRGTLTLQFKGQTTTLSGATGQNLEQSFQPDFGLGRVLDDRAPSPFLVRLAQVRPDLRQRLGFTVRSAQEPTPLFIHGGAWEKTADHIGTYGDVDQNLAWKFLGADVSPGSTFDFQLVPSLASDVFLHALVVERKDAARVKAYSRELEVVYVVDYGVLAVVGEAADTIGYTRPVDYGSVIYVPDVGPVKDIERRGGFAGDVTDTPGFVLMALKSTSPGSWLTAVRE